MSGNEVFETILDNFSDGVFLLDKDGNFLYANSAYLRLLKLPKNKLENFNVHHFLESGQVEFLISDRVFQEKRQVIMFQDVYATTHTKHKLHRQLAIFTPIFGQDGEIKNILAVIKPLNQINDEYYEASRNIISTFSLPAVEHRSMEQDFIVAESPAMQGILRIAHEVADSDASVLISGESGTGKDVIAHYIHDCSYRRKQPMVIINCAALPESLLEAELFGYEKGAFTGSSPGGKQGLFEAAMGGTLFLDEINSMPLSLQGKLLRVIETKTIQRIGSTGSRTIDFRLLVATNQDLARLVQEQRFRADLFYRINVIPIVIPPLRSRREDIVPLALKFLERYCKKNAKYKVFSQQTLDSMHSGDWPGNVRELKNFVERSVLMSGDINIELPALTSVSPAAGRETPAQSRSEDVLCFAPTERYSRMVRDGVSMDDYLSGCEEELLDWAFRQYGSTYKVAQALSTSQASVMRRKKKYFSAEKQNENDL